MLKYRLKFHFIENEDTAKKRNEKIDILFSDINDIISDSPIRTPAKNEVISFSGANWVVDRTYLSFETQDDITYYTTNINLHIEVENKNSKKEEYDWFDKYKSKSGNYDQFYEEALRYPSKKFW